MPIITDYHAKYYAHELTRCHPSGDLGGIVPTLMSAQVDLNPHQVDSALFAFKSPLSKGAILADEVGLGKTIEAGILLSQKWAERKQNLLVIVPASLRKQWNQELWEKFFLHSFILETKSFNKALKDGNKNPFRQEGKIVICSYQFARNKSEYARQISWDLIVIDEAHRLRNVYKPQNKISRTLKEAFRGRPKILLTATPLQNSLMELYGLTSFVDEYIFGDQKSFKAQYSAHESYDELKKRLSPICQRALRRQVQEYVKYTKRIPITEEFTPIPDEQLLYDNISAYLQRDNLYTLPAGQKHLITLVLRKLLASSSDAISSALTNMIARLETKLTDSANDDPLKKDKNLETLLTDFESFENTKEEWDEEDLTNEPINSSKEEREAIKEEIDELKGFQQLALSIRKNESKGQSLLKALKLGFQKARELGALQKVIIFTEFRKTQKYLFDLLTQTEYAGKIVLFNGLNNDPISKQIYKGWLAKYKDSDRITGSKTSDMRSALVDYFKESAQIMIATEAASEGINLQFCSFVVNYDLPWNPQRIEQRIGRCHRYGQKHDVVVLNFLNKNNAADQRVLELLSEKFQLFKGVFGASDEVLGSIESGVDFEKRILEIYQKCRTNEEVQQAFNSLQEEMAEPISDKMKKAKKTLFENFDEEVIEKLKVKHKNSQEYLNKYEGWLLEMTKSALKDHAVFDEDKDFSFTLKSKPFGLSSVHLGSYKMGRHIKDSHVYRINHPLAKKVIEDAIESQTPVKKLIFRHTHSSPKISILKNLIGKSGLLRLTKITIESFEREDHLIFSALTHEGLELDPEQCSRLFSLPAKVSDSNHYDFDKHLRSIYQKQRESIISENKKRNENNFDQEMDKLDAWAEDRKGSLEQELKDMEKAIKELKRDVRKTRSLPEKIQLQKKANSMESKRNRKWKSYDTTTKEIENKKETLLDEIENRLRQKTKENIIFEIEWEIVDFND